MKCAPPPKFENLMEAIPRDRLPEILPKQSALQCDKYLHWNELRYKNPPQGLTHEEWWLMTKLLRKARYKEIPHKDKEGRYFVYAEPDVVRQSLHHLDIQIGPGLQNVSQAKAPAAGRQHLINSLIEEAITSSQLEGASTTREVAKEVLKHGGKPKDVSERMIVNNYAAVQFVYEVKDEDLRPETVLHIHEVLTEGTLDTPQDVGRLRHSDNIVVTAPTGSPKYYPPQAAELKKRLNSLCRFANQRSGKVFLHPIIRAIILHFLLGYDHPFVDGNGRTARALFYWSLLRDGYDVVQYIPISRKIKLAPAQYAKAYLCTETDESDMTYFIIHQLGIMQKALNDTCTYLEKKSAEMAEVDKIIRQLRLEKLLNHRQKALLSRALRKPQARFTVASHRHSHNIVYQTARIDLLKLEQYGLLEKHQQGKEFVFMPVKDIRRKLKRVAA